MIVLLYAAMLGGTVIFALLWPYGFLYAVIGAPFGASILVAATAMYLARRKAELHKDPVRKDFR